MSNSYDTLEAEFTLQAESMLHAHTSADDEGCIEAVAVTTSEDCHLDDIACSEALPARSRLIGEAIDHFATEASPLLPVGRNPSYSPALSSRQTVEAEVASPQTSSRGYCYQLFGAPLPETLKALRADIAKRGVQVPVEVDEEGQILFKQRLTLSVFLATE
jgi:hypothetical protein